MNINFIRERLTSKRALIASFIMLVSLCCVIVMNTPLYAISLNLNPMHSSRNVNGKVRVHIELKGAVNLLSCGVTLTFDPSLLQVDEAKTFKNNEVWVMEGENASYTDPPITVDNTTGTVKMIGGRLTGFNGDTLIGAVTFACIGRGTAYLTLNRANPPPYDNFVDDAGTVLDPVEPLASGVICIVDTNAGDAPACEIDANGDGNVTNLEKARVSQAFGLAYPDPAYNPTVDFNGDGIVTNLEKAQISLDFGRTDCPKCWEVN